jgi:hypothetical protein
MKQKLFLAALLCTYLPCLAHAQTVSIALNGQEVVSEALSSQNLVHPQSGAPLGVLFQGEKQILDATAAGDALSHTIKWTFVVNEGAIAAPGANANGGVLAQYQMGKMVEVISDQASDGPRHFKVNFAVPTSEKYAGVKVALLSLLSLTADANGGVLTCSEEDTQQQNPLLTAGFNFDGSGGYDVAGQASYWCNFQMSTSGSGTLQTSNTFGLPFPANGISQAGTVSSIGLHFSGSITPGEKVGASVSVLMSGKVVCEGDLNGDGQVDGIDLQIILSNWGASGGQADANADGAVDSIDLSVVLGNYGACQ